MATTPTTPDTAAKKSLSIRETADELGVSPDTVSRMVRRGEIPAWRIGPKLIRIDADELHKLRRPVTPTAAFPSARESDAR